MPEAAQRGPGPLRQVRRLLAARNFDVNVVLLPSHLQGKRNFYSGHSRFLTSFRNDKAFNVLSLRGCKPRNLLFSTVKIAVALLHLNYKVEKSSLHIFEPMRRSCGNDDDVVLGKRPGFSAFDAGPA